MTLTPYIFRHAHAYGLMRQKHVPMRPSVLCALRACAPADRAFLALVAVHTTPRGRWLAHVPLQLQLAGAARGRRSACVDVPCKCHACAMR